MLNEKSPEVAALIAKLKTDNTPLKNSSTIHEDWTILFSSKHYIIIIKTDPPITKNFEIRGKQLTEDSTVADVVAALKL